jgi:hypothetical protein
MIFEKARQNAEEIKKGAARAIEDAKKAGAPAYYMHPAVGEGIIKEMPDGIPLSGPKARNRSERHVASKLSTQIWLKMSLFPLALKWKEPASKEAGSLVQAQFEGLWAAPVSHDRGQTLPKSRTTMAGVRPAACFQCG